MAIIREGAVTAAIVARRSAINTDCLLAPLTDRLPKRTTAEREGPELDALDPALD